MKLKRPNKALEAQIKLVIRKMSCPIHRKEAVVSMDDEEAEVKVEACCIFFQKDVFVAAERIRKDFLYRDEKRREREERDRKKGLR